MSRILCALFLMGLLAAPAFGQQNIEQRKIAYLISAIADLHDATFIRNGSEYDAGQAVQHLRLKLSRAGARVKTAEDFIRYCATGSSVSGERYTIRFGDGRTVAVADFMHARLAAYDMASARRGDG